VMDCRALGSIGASLAAIFTKRKLTRRCSTIWRGVDQSRSRVATAAKITKAISKDRYDKDVDVEEVKGFLPPRSSACSRLMLGVEIDPRNKPFVILVVGVNGSGKTTTLASLRRNSPPMP